MSDVTLAFISGSVGVIIFIFCVGVFAVAREALRDFVGKEADDAVRRRESLKSASLFSEARIISVCSKHPIIKNEACPVCQKVKE